MVVTLTFCEVSISLFLICAGLWGIVNNAGICCMAELEMTSDKLFRNVLDVNLLGYINVTKMFLPLIRRAKGRVVNVSSIAGPASITVFLCFTWQLGDICLGENCFHNCTVGSFME